MTASSFSPSSLTGKQLRHLRALAHPLKPVVQVGRTGWTPAVRAQLDQALLDHELLKVKWSGEGEDESLEHLRAVIEEELNACVAQVIGKILVVYRPHPKKPEISLPRSN